MIMSTRKFIKKLTASLLFIAVVMSFGVQSAFAESNSPKATVKNNVVTFSNLDQLNSYYTHCYHDILYSYDSGGHLMDTTKSYHQAVGG